MADVLRELAAVACAGLVTYVSFVLARKRNLTLAYLLSACVGAFAVVLGMVAVEASDRGVALGITALMALVFVLVLHATLRLRRGDEPRSPG